MGGEVFISQPGGAGIFNLYFQGDCAKGKKLSFCNLFLDQQKPVFPQGNH
jgi:hypothetical protein